MAWKASFVGANTVKVPGLFRFSVSPADWIAATNVLQSKQASNASLQTTSLVSSVLGSGESYSCEILLGSSKSNTKMVIREAMSLWSPTRTSEKWQSSLGVLTPWGPDGMESQRGLATVDLGGQRWLQSQILMVLREPLTLGSQLIEGYLKFHSL